MKLGSLGRARQPVSAGLCLCESCQINSQQGQKGVQSRAPTKRAPERREVAAQRAAGMGALNSRRWTCHHWHKLTVEFCIVPSTPRSLKQ